MADIIGSDGRFLQQVSIVGAGIVGAPAGGVLTVQGPLGSGALTIGSGGTPADNDIVRDWVAYDGSGSGMSVGISVYSGAGVYGWVRQRTANTFKPQSAVAINPEATIWAPAAGKKFRLMGGTIASSVVGNVTLRDNTAGTIIAVVPCGVAGVGYPIFGPNAGNGILSAVANNVLTATGPGLATLSGTVFGTEE